MADEPQNQSSASTVVSQVVVGASPVPTILGYLLAGLTIADEVIKSNGMPNDRAGWFQIAGAVMIALLGRFTKQSNVTNSQNPGPAKQAPETALKASQPRAFDLDDDKGR